jgi:hypothetical protein
VAFGSRALGHNGRLALPKLEFSSMYKIVEARGVGLNIKQFVIEAPRIARKQQAGAVRHSAPS